MFPKDEALPKPPPDGSAGDFSTTGYEGVGEGSDFCKQESIYRLPSPPALILKRNKLCNNTENTPRIG